MDHPMPAKSSFDSSALVAVACCLIVVGSSSSDHIGAWKYLFDLSAVALCLLALVRSLRGR